jgi:hypothetical protein
MADNNDALFREVDEELRREQLEKLWKQYGTYILGAAFLIVALVGGKQLWDQQRRAAAESAGALYAQALALAAEGKAEDAEKALVALSTDGPTGYAALASLNLAGQHLKAGKTADALAIFEKLAASAPDPLLADFARLQAAGLKLGEADFSEMQNRLDELTSDTSPWRIPARELLGNAAFKAGQLGEARKILTPIIGDTTAPREVVERVEIIMSAIASAEQAKPAAGAEQGTAGTTGQPAK